MAPMPDPGELGTILFDLDGTLVYHGTTKWLPNALEVIAGVEARGYEARFVTRRGDREFEGHPVYGEAPTRAMLRKAGLASHHIWFDVRSPRVLIDDSRAWVYRRQPNAGFDVEAIMEGLAKVEAPDG